MEKWWARDRILHYNDIILACMRWTLSVVIEGGGAVSVVNKRMSATVLRYGECFAVVR